MASYSMGYDVNLTRNATIIALRNLADKIESGEAHPRNLEITETETYIERRLEEAFNPYEENAPVHYDYKLSFNCQSVSRLL